jgi:hypothetical protein
MFVTNRPLGLEMRKVHQIASLFLLSALLCACGGGGGSSAYSDPASPSKPPTADNPSSSPQVPVARASLSWYAPSQREDGTALSDDEIAGYELYHIVEDSGDMNIIEVDGNITQYQISLTAGTHEFGIAVVDVNGIRSPISEMQSISVN